MKILMRRLGEESSDTGVTTPLIEDPSGGQDRHIGNRLAFARASLRSTNTGNNSRTVSVVPSEEKEAHINWFYNDMFAIQSLITASWLNLLLVCISACVTTSASV